MNTERTVQQTNPMFDGPRIVVLFLGLVVFILSVPVAMRAVSQKYTAFGGAVPEADVIVIPGASVVHGEPSPVLLARAQAALKLYKEKKAPRVLVSGYTEAKYDEVTPVRNFLLSNGVPASDIFLDAQGLDTYSSMYRAKWIFGAKKILVVSQDFHIPRCIYIARALGMDAYGVAVEGGAFAAYAREVPASWKALIDLLLHRQPKFLGAPMPLAGGWRGAAAPTSPRREKSFADSGIMP